jgi:hypothetical protein
MMPSHWRLSSKFISSRKVRQAHLKENERGGKRSNGKLLKERKTGNVKNKQDERPRLAAHLKSANGGSL